jgi:restriction system protein
MLMWPTVLALRALGGSGRVEEIDTGVIKLREFTDEQQAQLTSNGKMPKLNYNLAWARTRLKHVRVVENSARAVWRLTELGRNLTESECRELARKGPGSAAPNPNSARGQEGATPDDWKSRTLERLKAMSPVAFERLAQRLLREAGFRNVQVLGKSGDGGIDGVGVYRVSLVSFPIYFQCKRYKGSVSAGAVRDFRGAMAGRGENGLLITSGSFTASAQSEATRDGATPVELVDGDALCDLLKKYRLGISVTERTVEDIDVEPQFFDQFEE